MAVSYSFFLDPSYFFMSVKIDYLNFHEKDEYFCLKEKEKKCAKKKRRKIDEYKLQTKLMYL